MIIWQFFSTAFVILTSTGVGIVDCCCCCGCWNGGGPWLFVIPLLSCVKIWFNKSSKFCCWHSATDAQTNKMIGISRIFLSFGVCAFFWDELKWELIKNINKSKLAVLLAHNRDCHNGLFQDRTRIENNLKLSWKTIKPVLSVIVGFKSFMKFTMR